MSTVGGVDRGALRRWLRAAHPWITDPEIGPTAVSAGECDRCGQEARLVQPCGPPPEDLPAPATPDWGLGRSCAAALGPQAWCAGHEEAAQDALRQLAALPADADQLARLWWLSTGEIRPDPALVAGARELMAAGGAAVPGEEGD